MKSYQVLLLTRKPSSIAAAWTVLKGIGKVAEISTNNTTVFAVAVQPDNQDLTSSDIRDAVRQTVDVFNDKVLVTLIDADAMSTLNWEVPNGFLGEVMGEKVKRNFERFSNRHEAYVQWQKEKPRWVYPDGINAAIVIDVDQWCWLPIKPDGIYESSLEAKYIRG